MFRADAISTAGDLFGMRERKGRRRGREREREREREISLAMLREMQGGKGGGRGRDVRSMLRIIWRGLRGADRITRSRSSLVAELSAI